MKVDGVTGSVSVESHPNMNVKTGGNLIRYIYKYDSSKTNEEDTGRAAGCI